MTPYVHPDVRAFADAVHAEQYYNGGPYSIHLDHVVELVAEIYPTDPELACAAYLHDVLEDGRKAGITPNDLRGLPDVTERVLRIVQAVTRGPGTRRKTIPAALEATRNAGPDAILVKLADRMANVESCWDNRDSRLFMYYREYLDFRAALYAESDTHLAALWARLDNALGWRD